MANRFADLNAEELATLKALISEVVTNILDVYIDDESDEGLTFNPAFIARVLASANDGLPSQAASEVYQELAMIDPDESLTLRPEVEARLLKFLRDRPSGQAAADVYRELYLDS